MTTEQRKANRQQLAQCFMDLGNRSKELNESAIASVCFVVAGTIIEGSDELFAMWTAEYARARISMINETLNEKE